MGGAPNNPLASTSQPTRLRTSPRAAARQTKFATVAPVTNPTDACRGRLSRSSSQRAAIVSAADAAGAAAWFPAFCPQPEVSQSAATPIGCEAPQTQPKNRGPIWLCRPTAVLVTRSSRTSSAGCRSQVLAARRPSAPPGKLGQGAEVALQPSCETL